MRERWRDIKASFRTISQCKTPFALLPPEAVAFGKIVVQVALEVLEHEMLTL